MRNTLILTKLHQLLLKLKLHTVHSSVIPFIPQPGPSFLPPLYHQQFYYPPATSKSKKNTGGDETVTGNIFQKIFGRKLHKKQRFFTKLLKNAQLMNKSLIKNKN